MNPIETPEGGTPEVAADWLGDERHHGLRQGWKGERRHI